MAVNTHQPPAAAAIVGSVHRQAADLRLLTLS